jgi:hypothetical protein
MPGAATAVWTESLGQSVAMNCLISLNAGIMLSIYIHLPKRLGCPASGRDRLHPLL